MKEMGMTFEESLEFPISMAYQLQHAHCRAMDKICKFVVQDETEVNTLKQQFEMMQSIDTHYDDLDTLQ